MSSVRTRSAWAYERLLVAYPREVRRDAGPEMVQLVQDRVLHGGEPWWHLWPLLLADTAANAAKARWNVVVTRYRAMAIGALVAVALLAYLSDGVRGLPVVLVAGVAGWAIWRGRPVDPDVAPPSPRRWLVAGAGLVAASVSMLLVVGDREMDGWEWGWTFFTMLFGVFALVTGLLLRLGGGQGTPGSGRHWWARLVGLGLLLLVTVRVGASLGVEAWILGFYLAVLGVGLLGLGVGGGVLQLARRRLRA